MDVCNPATGEHAGSYKDTPDTDVDATLSRAAQTVVQTRTNKETSAETVVKDAGYGHERFEAGIEEFVNRKISWVE